MSSKYLKESYFSFKKVNGLKIPFLCDYLKHDGAIDPLIFTNKSYKTYFEFVATTEKESHPEFNLLLEDEFFKTFLEFLQQFLPAKRPYEWSIFDLLFNSQKNEATFEELLEHSKKFVEENSVNEKYFSYDELEKVEQKIKAQNEGKIPSENYINLQHACKTLNGEFSDSTEKEKFANCFIQFKNQKVELSKNIQKLKNQPQKLEWILDTIKYALLRYDFEFGSTNYSLPFLKLYQKYTMRDTALLCNYTKIHSSFRGQGLLTSAAPDYFIFVNLEKDKDIRDEINYKDKFITPEVFQWQSPNSTKQESKVGKNLIFNQERKIRLHLFVRKFKEVEGVVQPFMYLGQVITIKDSAKGDKPITMNFALLNRVQDDIYTDLTTVVKIDNKKELDKN